MKKIKQFFTAILKIDKIAKGVYRLFFKKTDEIIQNDYQKKMDICKGCENIDIKGDRCLVMGTQPCCGICGCSLNIKIVSGDKCPIGKW